MKRVYISIALLVLVFVISFFGYVFLTHSFDTLYKTIEKGQDAANKENSEILREATSIIEETWNSKKVIFSLFIKQNELGNLENKLNLLFFYCNQEMIEEYKEKAVESKTLIKALKDSQALSIENIF